MVRAVTSLLVGLLVIFSPALAYGQVNVWSEISLIKVRPFDLPKTNATAAVISAARGEYEAFQLVIRSTGSGVERVDVEMSDLTSDRGARISCKANCTIYREAFINIQQPSGLFGAVGEWPDALIPKEDRYFGERRNAFPFDLAADRTQPIWIEVYVPSDATPGLYSGVARVSARGLAPIRMPVSLRVRAFAIPATSSLKASFLLWTDALPYRHTAARGEALDNLSYLYSKSLLMHRITNGALLGFVRDWEPDELLSFTSDSINRLKLKWGPFFDGTVLENGARITTVQPSFEICLDGTFCRPEVFHLFEEQGWMDRLLIYLPDEPVLSDPAQIAMVQQISNQVHSMHPELRASLTAPYSALLEPEVETWIFPLSWVSQALQDGTYWPIRRRAKELRKEVWVYQACFTHNPGCGAALPPWPGYPDYIIDVQGSWNRIQDWLNWYLELDGELYWAVNWGYREADPWGTQFFLNGNGEGNLYYPGTPAVIGGNTEIPIESTRLKLKRDGLEDYEYLSMLARCGDAETANSAAQQLVTSPVQWQTDPAVLLAVRERVASAIESSPACASSVQARGRSVRSTAQDR